MTENRPQIRRATKKDAADLAILNDIASKGLASWRWQQAVNAGKAGNAFDFGRNEMANENNMFGFSHAVIAEIDDVVAGGCISCPLPASMKDEDFIREGVLAPLGELTQRAVGTWFIDSVAIFDNYRRQGLGSFMLQTAGKIAVEAGYNEICLIAISDNESALNLYEDNGFVEFDRRPFIDWHTTTEPRERFWLLLKRTLAN